MPALGTVATLQDGSKEILTTAGWVPHTQDLESAAAMGTIGALLSGATEAMSLGLVQSPDEFSQVSPLASAVSPAVEIGAGATGLAGIVRGGIKAGMGTVAERVVKKVNSQRSGLIRRPSDIVGGRATATGQLVQKVEAGLETIPGLNLGLLAQMAINQRRVNMSAAKAMGATDDVVQQARLGLGDNVLEPILAGFQTGFRATEKAITGGLKLNKIDVAPVIDQAIDSKFITGKLAARLKQGDATGEELMAVRSKLTDVLGSNEQHLVKEQAAEVMEQIDDIIELALDGDNLRAFQELRSRFRVWANIRRGRGLSADGQLNVASVGGRMANNYGDTYRTILADGAGGVKGAHKDVNDFLRILKEGERLSVKLPNSGTAERSIMVALGAGGIAASR